jgi:hypothetical protein
VEGGQTNVLSILAYGLGEITHYGATMAVETPREDTPVVVKGQQVHYNTSYPSVLRIYDVMGRIVQAQQVYGTGYVTVSHKGYVLVSIENEVQHFTQSAMIL